MVLNLPAHAGTLVWSLGQEDSLEKEMATHSSIPAWDIPWTEEPGGLQSMGSQSHTRPGTAHQPCLVIVHILPSSLGCEYL